MTASAQRKRENAEVRKAQILDEAIGVIARGGYNAFTIQEMAKRCGLTCAGLLYHFPSKDALVLAVLGECETREAEIIGPLVEATRRALPPEESRRAVLILLRTMAERAAAQPHIGRLMMMLQTESLDETHPAHAWWRRRETVLLDLFARVISPHARDPQASALLLLATFDGLAQHWLRLDQSFDLVAKWEDALTLILPGIMSQTYITEGDRE